MVQQVTMLHSKALGFWSLGSATRLKFWPTSSVKCLWPSSEPVCLQAAKHHIIHCVERVGHKWWGYFRHSLFFLLRVSIKVLSRMIFIRIQRLFASCTCAILTSLHHAVLFVMQSPADLGKELPVSDTCNYRLYIYNSNILNTWIGSFRSKHDTYSLKSSLPDQNENRTNQY